MYVYSIYRFSDLFKLIDNKINLVVIGNKKNQIPNKIIRHLVLENRLKDVNK